MKYEMSIQTEVKYFSLEEIKLNNGVNGAACWIIYKNKVYNVTDYVDDVSSFIISLLIQENVYQTRPHIICN